MMELERELPSDAARGADPSSFPRVAVIGPGRVGRSIAAGAERAGIDEGLAGRGDYLDAARDADVALLCVPDAEIETSCADLKDAIPPLRFVGHVSGATTLAALSTARDSGAETLSLHPLQTIPDAESDLVGAPCAIAGSTPDALALARRLATRLEMRPFEVPDESRAAYHAAASIASNLLVALEESAAELMQQTGIDADARDLLAPLVLRTAANWAERGPAALTGPIARDDAETIERHLAALRELAPELVPMYEALAERARVVATETAEATA
jgi:predicted short-subunit dehydrogenase-like oxidoreductase (DUF2520 family)